MKATTTDELCLELHKNGIKSMPFIRAPFAQEIFGMNLDRDVLWLWKGNAEIDFYPDPSHRQAVLVVNELDRTITRKYRVRLRRDATDTEWKKDARANFPIQVPNSTIEIDNLGPLAKPRWQYDHDRSRLVTATLSAPAQTNTFLVGIDETRHFISPLPSPVRSVRSAHKLLRPADVPAKALRQGEFFFVPATEQELKEIKKRKQQQTRPSYNYGPHHGTRLERDSSHHIRGSYYSNGAPYSSNWKVEFVKGQIHDSRSARHAPLDLSDGWYKVVRNTEITMPTTGTMRRRRSWD